MKSLVLIKIKGNILGGYQIEAHQVLYYASILISSLQGPVKNLYFLDFENYLCLQLFLERVSEKKEKSARDNLKR